MKTALDGETYKSGQTKCKSAVQRAYVLEPLSRNPP